MSERSILALYRSRGWALFALVGGAFMFLFGAFTIAVELINHQPILVVIGALPLILLGPLALFGGIKGLQAQRATREAAGDKP